MRGKFPQLHPFLFALISLLSVYTGARLIASPLQLIRPLFVLWGLLLLLRPLSKWLVRDEDWADILLSIFAFGFYFTQSQFFKVGLFSLVFAAAVMLGLWLLKKKIQVRAISLSLTIVGLVMATSQIISLAIILKPIPFSYYQTLASRTNLPSLLPADSSQQKPDIYYIILDGYPRADVLADLYHYDNQPFISELQDLGFVVPAQSHSNYARTAISVSTTLDMQYWDDISPDMEKAVYWWLVEPVIDRNRLRASLEAIGYKYFSIATDWGITNNPSADVYLKPYPLVLSDFENYFLSSTPLRYLYAPFQRFGPITTNDVHRDYIMYDLDALKKAPLISGPKFVFSHIIVPHPPFVFEADGTPIESSASFTFNSPDGSMFSPGEYKKRYVEQVEFVNAQMRQVIRSLLDRSQTPPIIIIQADHGSAIYVDFDDLQGSCMKERFAIFSAIYLPGKSPDAIPKNLSAVNTFRIVLNEYFGAQLPLLEDRQYFMNGYYLFDLQDVTERMDDACVVAP